MHFYSYNAQVDANDRNFAQNVLRFRRASRKLSRFSKIGRLRFLRIVMIIDSRALIHPSYRPLAFLTHLREIVLYTILSPRAPKR